MAVIAMLVAAASADAGTGGVGAGAGTKASVGCEDLGNLISRSRPDGQGARQVGVIGRLAAN